MRAIYHICSRAAWQAAVAAGSYCGDTLATEGFIHCSTRAQVVEVADRIFRGRRDLCLLLIDEEAVARTARVVYENLEGGTEQYPHIYGPLPVAAVRGEAALVPGDDGRFSFPQGLGEASER